MATDNGPQAPKNIVEPFRATHYSDKYLHLLDSLAIPLMETATELWGKETHKYNFRSVLMGSGEECAHNWRSWLEQKIMMEEPEAAFYILRNEFQFRQKSKSRWAIYASIDVNHPNILVHEDTFPEGVENARLRYEACEADLTPIFVGFSDEYAKEFRELLQQAIVTQKADMLYQEQPENVHKLWKNCEANFQEAITDFFQEKKLYILDGHHRFAAAKKNAAMGKGDGRILACIASMSMEDLLLLPIHRSVMLESWLMPEVGPQQLVQQGLSIKAQLEWSPDSVFELIDQITKEKDSFLFLPAQSSKIYQMQVNTMNAEFVVEALEQLFQTKFPQANVIPVAQKSLLLAELASGQAQAAIFLPIIESKVVREVADQGKMLPRKSTRFYPKPSLGLVCRQWQSFAK